MSSTSRPRGLVWFLGMLAMFAVVGLLCGAAALLMFSAGKGAALAFVAYPSFVVAPLLGGVVAAYCWRSLQPTIGQLALQVLYATLAGLVLAAIVMREGAICLLIVSPLLYGLLYTGAALGRVWFRHDPTKLRLAIFPLLALALVGEPLTRSPVQGSVVDEILIHAPPERVWSQVTAFPTIPAPANFWLFRLGLPYPVATTSAGDFVGADRRCIFSAGAVFTERVSELVPREKLTFEIIGLPNDPELIGHLTPHRGQFLLRDNHDGTTTLIGTTWYTLHVRPLWYFDAWTQSIFRAVHLRVMDDVRRRAEA